MGRRPKRRRSRSLLPLDIQRAFAADPGSEDGWVRCLFEPIKIPGGTKDDLEVEFWESIIRRNPDHVDALTILGEVYTRRGDYRKGLDADIRLARLKPNSCTAHYNLACSYALTGQKKFAFEELAKSIELGYRDAEHMRRDRDLDALKDDPRWKVLMEKLEEKARG
ncbi:MAG: hypothetical protein N3A38_07380 [Planctomycetota bacterium]|nr:hypothetical protein [Planctomycetota bacterium]